VPNSSEGVRRLSIFAGGISAFLWVVWFLQNNRISGDEPLLDWLLLIGITVGFFFVGFALVRAIAWVIQGFARKKD
jgi:hypothetical protein